MKYRDFANRISASLIDVTDAEVIKQHLFRLLTTNKGEVLDNPNYGSNLRGFLYEPLNAQTVGFIQMEIERAISIWEPRVELIRAEVRKLDTHELVIFLSCYVPEFDTYISFDANITKG